MTPRSELRQKLISFGPGKSIMSYRRPGKKLHEEWSKWQSWLAENGELIAASGLPAVVLTDEEHWADFLMHGGYLDHHPDPSGFSASRLSLPQKAALLRLIINWHRDAAPDDMLLRRLIHEVCAAVERVHDS
jgi:hypothetical protein